MYKYTRAYVSALNKIERERDIIREKMNSGSHPGMVIYRVPPSFPASQNLENNNINGVPSSHNSINNINSMLSLIKVKKKNKSRGRPSKEEILLTQVTNYFYIKNKSVIDKMVIDSMLYGVPIIFTENNSSTNLNKRNTDGVSDG